METRAIDFLIRSVLRNFDFCMYLTQGGVAVFLKRSKVRTYAGVFGYSHVQMREHSHPLVEASEGLTGLRATSPCLMTASAGCASAEGS